MNEIVVMITSGVISYVFMGFLFIYLYKDSRVKYLLDLSISWYCSAGVFIVYLIDEFILLNEKYLPLIDLLTYIAIFFLFKAMCSFIKINFTNKYIFIKYIAEIIVLFIIGMIIFKKEIYTSCIFSGVISSVLVIVVYNFKLGNQKITIGDACIIIGALFEGISMINQSETMWDTWTFISINSILVIGIGFVLCYYEKVKFKLEESDHRCKRSIEASNSELWEYDIGTDFITAHKDYYNINDVHKPIKQKFECNIHEEDLQRVKNTFRQHLEGKTDRYNVEYRIKCSNGEYKWILSKGKAVTDKNGKIIKIFGSDTDISDVKKAQEKIRKLAYYDSLTELMNRNSFLNELKKEIKVAKELNRKFAVICIDFDNFKLVNDTLGHSYGDKFLKIISHQLIKLVNEKDILSRFGGDEFNILQKDIKDDFEVEKLINKITGKLKKQWVIGNYEFDITASIGISIYPSDADRVYELLKKADIAMYNAKNHGKNQYKFFKEYMGKELKDKINMQIKLKEAIKNNSFSVYYQPQVDIKTGKISGAEALIRWIDSDNQVIPPSKFISLAEETGLIMPIGEYVLRTACIKNKQCNSLLEEKISVSVNISGVQLNQSNFVEVIKRIIDETEVKPSNLILEITENVLIKSLGSNIKKLEQLKKLGIKIALDDFGTGYSSLNYILNLPIDILKIDKSFVDDITKNSKKQCIIESIISLAQKIDLKVVAEGVEFKEQNDILIKQNCNEVQGYYFSKPLLYDDFEKYVKTKIH